MNLCYAPAFAVLYREPGDPADSISFVLDTGTQADEVERLLNVRGIRAQAVTVSYTPDSTVFAAIARKTVGDIGENVADQETTDADALNHIAMLTPGMDDKLRVVWFEELVRCIHNERRQRDDSAFDRDVDWQARAEECIDILAGLQPAPEGVTA